MKLLRICLTSFGLSALLLGSSPKAIDMTLSTSDFEAALDLARSDAATRAAFHRPYVLDAQSPAIGRLEVVTELRRLVLLGEEHVAGGDLLFTRGTREATDALTPWKGRVSILAEVRLDPRNSYVLAPPIDIALQGRSGAVTRFGQRSRSLFGAGTPGAHYPVLGAEAEADFAAAPLEHAEATLVLSMDGRAIYRGPIDFRQLN